MYLRVKWASFFLVFFKKKPPIGFDLTTLAIISLDSNIKSTQLMIEGFQVNIP
jgi:hypothetical protein